MCKKILMKSAITYTITVLGIGLAMNLFASASGTKVNPSTINLSAQLGAGPYVVISIHTQLPAGTPISCIHIVDSTSTDFTVYPSDIIITEDSLSHVVLTIGNWGTEITPYIATGVATFYIYGDGGCGTDYLTEDDATIIDRGGNR